MAQKADQMEDQNKHLEQIALQAEEGKAKMLEQLHLYAEQRVHALEEQNKKFRKGLQQNKESMANPEKELLKLQ